VAERVSVVSPDRLPKISKTTPCTVAGGGRNRRVWAENLTRRANQRHKFIIPEFANDGVRNIAAIACFAWLDR
jgi:hypothetical protein